jgi:hypothetical protein
VPVILTLNVTMTAPSAPGSYVLRQRMVKENIGWFGDMLRTNVTVGTAQGAALTSSATTNALAEKSTAAGVPPTTYWAGVTGAVAKSASAGSSLALPLTLANLGGEMWKSSGSSRVKVVVYLDPVNSAAPGLMSAPAASAYLSKDVASGGSMALSLGLAIPRNKGAYTLRIRLIGDDGAVSDYGLQSAITNFCARFLAVRDSRKLNEVISTALFYFTIIGVCIMGTSPVLAHFAPQFFKVLPRDRAEFSTLVLMTGLSWGLCIMLHMFLSALDGFQRFDLSSRIAILQVVLRSAGYFIALEKGQGLIAMAWIFIGTQILGYILYFFCFRHAFPELQISRAFVKWPMFQDIFRYGIKSFVASNSTLVLQQSGTVSVGTFAKPQMPVELKSVVEAEGK